MPVSGTLRAKPCRFKDFLLLLSTLFIFYLLFYNHHQHHKLHPSTTLLLPTPPLPTTTTTTLHHLLFSIASSSDSLPKRIPYVRLWYKPNSTRAFLFIDRYPTPGLSTSDPSLPPILVSAPTSRFPYTFPKGLRSAIRVARIVKEAFDLNEPNVRWYIFGDDDTIFFTDNLARTLSRYDHNEWYYVGSNSESWGQNDKYSFDMAFGGGGFAISCSLARVLARVLDSCLMRYPQLYGSDARVYACLVELGVGLTHEPGFHQVDVRGNLFGMLAAHPLSLLLSLHHLDAVNPIFPNMSTTQALEHLFKAVNLDPARILQQTVCYDHTNSLTVSIAWGYAVQVFEGNQLLPDLLPLQRTFMPWRRGKNVSSSHYMFNTREYPSNPCKRPTVFFLESVDSATDKIYTEYTRYIFANCIRTNGVKNLEYIRVFSEKLDFDIGKVKSPRRQCCDILSLLGRTMVVGIRKCRIDEQISMKAQDFL